MTEVWSLPMQPESPSFFQRSGALKSSSSTSSLFLEKNASRSADLRRPYTPPAEHQENLHNTPPQWSCPPQSNPSTSSYPAISYAASDESATNSSNSSVSSDVSEDTDITFPNYDGDYGQTKDAIALVGPPENDLSDSTTTDTTISESPLLTPVVVDDTAVRQEPSRQVDFLSHEWREEDIWSSWRNIVSQRKTIYGERSRLENASWRTWAKAKFDLRTVSPERLNWLKESDVTWLYGPLKVATSYPVSDRCCSQTASHMSKNNSFVHKKPILKKRSVSEIMLQKSLSTSSLVKEAAASVQAQGRHYQRSGPEVVDSKLQSETPSRDQVDYFTSRSTSSIGTPYEGHEKRHIRFDDRVEQCIAVDCKDVGVDGEDLESGDDGESGDHAASDSSSDDGVVMMRWEKRSTAKRRPTASRSNSTSGRRIIETLPATTLKYRTDSPDITEAARHHTFGRSWSTGSLAPSPSQETLRPANPSTNFLLPNEDDDDEEDEDIDSDSSWSFGANNPKSSLGASAPSSSKDRSGSRRTKISAPAPRHVDFQVEGMRRTESGMFMPLDEDEDDIVQAGLFGRVSETINTARDIAHVIWNVGWRK